MFGAQICLSLASRAWEDNIIVKAVPLAVEYKQGDLSGNIHTPWSENKI